MSRPTPATLEEQLRLDEGEKLVLYKDSLGFWTIGVGRLLDPARGGHISLQESANMLANDITEKTAELVRSLPWVATMDPIRRETLINLAFQLGVPGLLTFKNTVEAVRQGDWEQAALGLKFSRLHAQTPDRTERHMEQLLTGIRQ